MEKHHCCYCLLDTELMVNSGEWIFLPKEEHLWYKTWKGEQKFFVEFIKRVKPKTVLEIGGGTGRIVSLIIKNNPMAKITVLERNPFAYQHLKKRFSQNKNVSSINQDALDYFKNHSQYFDLSVCLMNTLGDCDNIELLNKAVKHCKHFFFTVYDEKFDHKRGKMYSLRGDSSIQNGNVFEFCDSWNKKMTSRSFSRQELEAICERTGKKYTITKPSEILYAVSLY